MTTISTNRSLKGTLMLPGDKSISHRSLMFLSVAQGVAAISNLSGGADVMSTLAAMNQLGARISQKSDGLVWVEGTLAPELFDSTLYDIDCGNSGTTIRLLSGLLGGLNAHVRLFGDESLTKRPMKRVMDPLAQMGIEVHAQTSPHFPPLLIPRRSSPVKGIHYQTPMASAQVKSAVLLAGLYAPTGDVIQVTEPELSRDHTERMLNALGASVESITEGTNQVILHGRYTDLVAQDVTVPADISSAAFWMVGAALLPGSKVTFKHLGLNPSRLGVIDAMKRVGVQFDMANESMSLGEPMADVTVWADGTQGDLIIDRPQVPFLIDEIPVLTILGLYNDGVFDLSGAEELRVKESDRLGAMVRLLKSLNVDVEERPDGYRFQGNPNFEGPPIDTPYATHHDHRLVMALEILNLRRQSPIPIEGTEWVSVSYPGFYDDREHLLTN